MPVTVYWSLKGGSGTTVVTACVALACPADTLLVDLDGDLPAALGVPEPASQGVSDWFASTAPPASLLDLAVDVDATTRLLPLGADAVPPAAERWPDLAAWLTGLDIAVVVDAGIGPPPLALLDAGGRGIAVTRPCYLALRRAARLPCRPDGIVLVGEPGRMLRPTDVESAVGAPVVASVSLDPAVARAVDAGLLTCRLPRGIERELRGAA